MAKETKAQRDTIDRVMDEYKHGELKSGGGQKVKSRKQAIAIGLSEAGASNRQSSAENKRREARTKTRERKGGTAEQRRAGGNATKSDLYEQAKEKNVPGRSRMSKAELEKAVRG